MPLAPFHDDYVEWESFEELVYMMLENHTIL
jgi:hypothetical protein